MPDRPGDPSTAPDPAAGRAPDRDPGAAADAAHAPMHHRVKETLIAITISFTMAFVFRGFVVEGFLIPTGSMAPTLLGQHVRVRNELNGSAWTVNPRDYNAARQPLTVQGAPRRGTGGQTRAAPLELNDPMSGLGITRASEPLLAGERVFVLKYLDGLYEPARWDVVVFKAPNENINYIKRLVGMPGERLALVHGDAFVMPLGAAGTQPDAVGWDDTAWRIARKPEDVQRAVFQPVFDSRFTPPNSPEFRPPFEADGSGWEGLRNAPAYRYTRSAETTLRWRTELWPIDDYTPYNQLSAQKHRDPSADGRPRGAARNVYPVPDVSLAFGLEPDAAGAAVELRLDALGRALTARVAGGAAAVTVDGEPLDTAELELPPGRVTNLEFWHADQCLWLFADGRLVAGGPGRGGYELTPLDRLNAALRDGLTLETLARGPRGVDAIGRPDVYAEPTLSITLSGGPATLHRVALARDIAYQPAPTFATRPDTQAVIDSDHYFFCGDNSSSSADSRVWPSEPRPVNPWIDDLYASPPGLVHHELLTGKAFVVYLPAPLKDGPLPTMFDFGAIRWIR